MTKQEFLAMSLPYKLKAKFKREEKKGCRQKVIGTIGVVYDNGSVVCYDTVNAYPEKFKMILHPLSDLTKEIEHKGERFIPMVKLLQVAYDEVVQGEDCLFSYGEDMYTLMINDTRWVFDVTNSSFYTFMDGLPMVVTNQMTLFSKLFEWHFDIADLISKGEAIDVNTLDTNPYK